MLKLEPKIDLRGLCLGSYSKHFAEMTNINTHHRAKHDGEKKKHQNISIRSRGMHPTI